MNGLPIGHILLYAVIVFLALGVAVAVGWGLRSRVTTWRIENGEAGPRPLSDAWFDQRVNESLDRAMRRDIPTWPDWG